MQPWIEHSLTTKCTVRKSIFPLSKVLDPVLIEMWIPGIHVDNLIIFGYNLSSFLSFYMQQEGVPSRIPKLELTNSTRLPSWLSIQLYIYGVYIILHLYTSLLVICKPLGPPYFFLLFIILLHSFPLFFTSSLTFSHFLSSPLLFLHPHSSSPHFLFHFSLWCFSFPPNLVSLLLPAPPSLFLSSHMLSAHLQLMYSSLYTYAYLFFSTLLPSHLISSHFCSSPANSCPFYCRPSLLRPSVLLSVLQHSPPF